jgi:pyruvate dehydrogenase E2 component (dihydrolipoamide acetyltransferase)
MSGQKINKLTMPKWGLTMEEGTVSQWLVKEGETVAPETPVVEIETDKSVQEVEVNVSGIVRRILVADGETRPVATLLAVIADADVSEAEIDAFITAESVSPNSAPALSSEEPEAEAVEPLATIQEFSRMRAAIARTVTAGWQIPQFPVTVAIDMGQAEALQNKLYEAGEKVSINDLVVKASAIALHQEPMVNASLADHGYILRPVADIAIAVGLKDGLMMPVIRDCQSQSLPQIAKASRLLIEQAQAESLSEEQLTGASFAISNLGKVGVDQFAALIPPGLAAILAVATISDQAVVRNGQIAAARMMQVTLSSDHRLVDGLCAARFLAALKTVLEAPAALR